MVGLKRAGLTPADIRILKQAYHLLYKSKLKLDTALETLESRFETPEIRQLVGFIRSSRRGICRE